MMRFNWYKEKSEIYKMLFLTLTVHIVGVFGVVDAALEYNNDCYSAIRNIIIIIKKKYQIIAL